MFKHKITIFYIALVSTTTAPAMDSNPKKEVSKDEYATLNLNFAMRRERTDEIKYWLQHGADANAFNKHGRTLLMSMAAAGDSAVYATRCLLESSSSIKVDLQDHLGRTALMYVLTNKYLPPSKKSGMVRLLLEFGANKLITDKMGKTAEQLALEDLGLG